MIYVLNKDTCVQMEMSYTKILKCLMGFWFLKAQIMHTSVKRVWANCDLGCRLALNSSTVRDLCVNVKTADTITSYAEETWFSVHV